MGCLQVADGTATLNIFGRISTSDGTHPSAFREAVVDFYKSGAVNAEGLPICKANQIEASDTKAAKRACGATIVGSGVAHAEIAFPEQKPIVVASPLIFFNGGEKDDKVLLLAHTFITVPAFTYKGRKVGCLEGKCPGALSVPCTSRG